MAIRNKKIVFILLLLSLHVFAAETTGVITFLKSAARVPFCFEDTDQWVCIAVNTHQICKYAGLEKFCEWLPDGSRLHRHTCFYVFGETVGICITEQPILSLGSKVLKALKQLMCAITPPQLKYLC